jgi:hypothetical protein
MWNEKSCQDSIEVKLVNSVLFQSSRMNGTGRHALASVTMLLTSAHPLYFPRESTCTGMNGLSVSKCFATDRDVSNCTVP